MSAEPEVLVEAGADQLAAAVARRTLDTLETALAGGADAHLVVTGGGILEAALTQLATPAGIEALDWRRVHVWWGDERYVPADSDDRNDLPALAKAFDALPLEPAKLHRMPSSDAGFPDAEAAAQSYASELAAVGGSGLVPAFDVVLLGVGPDGHCCSLFPHHPGTRVLDTSVIAVHESPKPPPDRLSLTFTALDAAKQIWFVASGEGKAEAVAKALSGAERTEVPSAGPRGLERTLWLVDPDAAAQLPTRVPTTQS
ncbi:6-phosphogluconolactonase [uncultured Jatrophihabitans sp.]|uniref:6-phosphogluconolactonase n=1 Tax=uncultured Jatrophihabitans sp. TaxID=1610747 RepID=UPI0035CC2A11